MIDISNSNADTDKLDDGRNYDSRKYYNQAFHYLKIGAFKPTPEFLISLSDLSPKLVKELAKLDLEDREFVLKQAIARIFEDINPKLYHNSISRVLNVRMVY